MLSLLKKLFGIRAAEKTEAQAPYKIEAPAVTTFPVETKPAKPAKAPAKIKAEKKPAAKKPAVKAKTARKTKATKKSA